MPWRKRAEYFDKTGNWTKLNTRKEKVKTNLKKKKKGLDKMLCNEIQVQDTWNSFPQFTCGILTQHWLFSTNHVGMEFLWNGGMFLEFLIYESKIMMVLSRLKDLLLLIQSNWFNWQKLVRGLNKLLWLRFYWWSINHNTLKLNQVKRACKRSFQFYQDNKRSCINSTYTAWYYLTLIATLKGTNK